MTGDRGSESGPAPESGPASGVSFVISSVPDAWKPDFISESEEAAHRVSELKRYLHEQKEVTCRR
jgi:telomerase protein component 1